MSDAFILATLLYFIGVVVVIWFFDVFLYRKMKRKKETNHSFKEM